MCSDKTVIYKVQSVQLFLVLFGWLIPLLVFQLASLSVIIVFFPANKQGFSIKVLNCENVSLKDEWHNY